MSEIRRKVKVNRGRGRGKGKRREEKRIGEIVRVRDGLLRWRRNCGEDESRFKKFVFIELPSTRNVWGKVSTQLIHTLLCSSHASTVTRLVTSYARLHNLPIITYYARNISP